MYCIAACNSNGRVQRLFIEEDKEIDEIMDHYCNSFEYVELLQGEPGNWRSVSRSW